MHQRVVQLAFLEFCSNEVLEMSIQLQMEVKLTEGHSSQCKFHGTELEVGMSFAFLVANSSCLPYKQTLKTQDKQVYVTIMAYGISPY
jgi:hypothetical protein